MKHIRPDHMAPMSALPDRPRFGTIVIRFIFILVVVVAIMAMIWSA